MAYLSEKIDEAKRRYSTYVKSVRLLYEFFVIGGIIYYFKSLCCTFTMHH